MPPEAMKCRSEDTIERNVTSPAKNHALMGRRVFTGMLVTAILPRIARPSLRKRYGLRSVPTIKLALLIVIEGFSPLSPIHESTAQR
jgi:hypothetical protein